MTADPPPAGPLVFLDIDGVLNSERWHALVLPSGLLRPSETAKAAIADRRFDPVCVKHLQTLVQATQARIVFSSSWRFYLPLPELIKVFACHGFPDAPVIDQTPNVLRGSRGEEIQAWLDAQNAETPYVILDDDELHRDNLRPKQVHTDPEIGLTEENVLLAFEILEQQISEADRTEFKLR